MAEPALRADAERRYAPRRSAPGFDRLALWMMDLRGWRRTLAAALLGALAVLALPPVYVVPALIPAFSGLAWLIASERSAARAIATGFWFGLGYFTAGLYWVANALLTRPEDFGWMAPIAPVGLALILAPFVAVATGLARLVAPRAGVGFVCALAGAWSLLEWARSWMFTGFPWNPVGSVWSFSPAPLQILSVIGVFGLSLLTVAAAAMPAVLARSSATRGFGWRAIGLVYALLALSWGAGEIRLAVAGPVAPTVDGVWLRLVQPNIPQSLKWRGDLLAQHLSRQVALGSAPAEPAPTHVIWSEAAAPVFLAELPAWLQTIGEHTPAKGVTILGALRTPSEFPRQVRNSLLAIDPIGRVVAHYDKSHLVPFGEYIPFRDLIPLQAVAHIGDLYPGNGVTTMRLPGLPPTSPLICYEVIFPGAVALKGDRPEWLLNLTNDGWYGVSAGPFQHLAASQARAVEEGLPLVRVANTGISAIIDPYGRLIARLPLDRAGALDGPLPQALARPTLYGRFGNAIPIALSLGMLAIGVVLSRRR